MWCPSASFIPRRFIAGNTCSASGSAVGPSLTSKWVKPFLAIQSTRWASFPPSSLLTACWLRYHAAGLSSTLASR